MPANPAFTPGFGMSDVIAGDTLLPACFYREIKDIPHAWYKVN
jgi:hypothetical protein